MYPVEPGEQPGASPPMQGKLRTNELSRTSIPMATTYFLDDGDGLRLQVCPNGAKYWLFAYTLNGRQGIYDLGMYPDTGLEDAREDASIARGLVADGIDPPRRALKPFV